MDVKSRKCSREDGIPLRAEVKGQVQVLALSWKKSALELEYLFLKVLWIYNVNSSYTQ